VHESHKLNLAKNAVTFSCLVVFGLYSAPFNFDSCYLRPACLLLLRWSSPGDSSTTTHERV
jgi:hypothetical protein